MGIFSAINIASSGMSAQNVRKDVIANNIANANTTRTPEGGPFRRSRTILRTRDSQPYWRSPFLPEALDNGIGTGVVVDKIEKDMGDTRLVYDPTHPDAHKAGKLAGYVEYPNVNVMQEMVDMTEVQRAYEANARMVDGSKSMYKSVVDLLRG
ncbi:MAG: flagellar basal body rod protein FlgC [Spirochaetota bacterium]